MFSQKEAVAVGCYLMERLYPNKCEAIGLYGSLARSGQGNDIDLIVFTPLTFTSKQFLEIGRNMKTEFETRQGQSPTKEEKAEIRRQAARLSLELDRLTPLEIEETHIDILVYPFHIDREGALEGLKNVGQEHDIEASIAGDLLFLNYQEKRFVRDLTD